MSKRIKILHIIDEITPNSGTCSIIMNYYRNIDKSKFVFDFITHSASDLEIEKELLEGGSKIHSFPKLKGLNIFKYIYTLNNFFKCNTEYKIIHGHLPNAAVFYLGMAKLYHVPIRIIHSHSVKSADKVYKKIRNKVLNSLIVFVANNFVACSNNAGEFLFGKRRMDKREVKILANGINFNDYSFSKESRNKLRTQYNLVNNLIIGHVGRFVPVKNHKFIIRAFSEYKKINSSSVLMLVGGGEQEAYIKNLVKEQGLEDSVIFTGIRNRVQEYLSAMDIFIFPSLFEGVGISAIEAQANGLPCIASGNVPNDIDIGNNLIKFISLDDFDSWIETLKEYEENAKRNTRQVIVDKRYDIKEIAYEVEKYYLSLGEK